MRRTLLALTAGALLGAPVAPAAADPRLEARLAGCQTAVAPEGRSATFRASMPRVPGAARLAMRFSLRQRLGALGLLRPVRVPGWDRWETASAQRAGLVFTKKVEALAAPAAYRAVVRFRWLDERGRVLRETVRRTRTCRQPDPRPDLRPGEVEAVPAGDGARYRIGVHNDGLEPAGAFGVVLVIDGTALPRAVVDRVGGGQRATVEVLGPRCAPGSRITVRVDPEDAVAEPHEGDNAARPSCPLGA
ncbi:MAG TPA: CARDB domain-containing protein [Baekduia sp.]|nr:CARDB domain-containing protein [Baekduia sp.]